MIELTVFTPAYNRAHTLSRTYASLQRQDCKEFIWLVVDDGSIDDTKELVQKWKEEERGFDIRYVYKENGGMHSAHNCAYRHIDTTLAVCIDSDDALADGAITKILKKWREIEKLNYAGIIGLDADLNTGKVLGTEFPAGMKDTTLMDFYAAGGTGDKKLVLRTEIVNKYPPYPEFPGEKYVALGYKYRLIDQDYKLAVLNEVLCNVEYQADGSSKTMYRQYLKNPQGFAFWRKVNMLYPVHPRRIFIECIHYVSSSIFAGNKSFISESPRKKMTILAIPFGLLLSWYIRIKVRND